MKTITRILAAVMLLCMALTLCACGETQPTTAAKPATQPTTAAKPTTPPTTPPETDPAPTDPDPDGISETEGGENP